MSARRWFAVILAGFATTAAGAAAASAQSAQPWSLQASVLAASQKFGDRSISGVGFEGQLRYTPAALWSLGGGVQYTSHPSGGDEMKITGVFLEPRYAFDIGSTRMAPYVAGRLALLKQALTLEAQPGREFSSGGSAIGAGAGLLIRATNTINLDFGAAFIRQSFSDATEGSQTVKFPAFTGYVAKGGLSFGFGTR
jgi:hypothetical protein